MGGACDNKSKIPAPTKRGGLQNPAGGRGRSELHGMRITNHKYCARGKIRISIWTLGLAADCDPGGVAEIQIGHGGIPNRARRKSKAGIRACAEAGHETY